MNNHFNSEQDRKAVELLRIVLRGVRRHGADRVIKTVESIDLEENNQHFTPIFDCIIKCVVDEFDIEQEHLYTTEVRGIVTTARKVAIIQAKHHLDISDFQLGKHFKRVRQVVYLTMREFDNLNRDDKMDAPFFEQFDRVNDKVVKYIDKLLPSKNGTES